MKHRFRSIAAIASHFLLATALYGWARAILHGLASGRLTYAGFRPVMPCAAFALAALMWVLYRRYHFVRRVAHFMLRLAFIRSLVYPHRTWPAAIAGCPLLALVARGRYRRTDAPTSTREANVPDAARDSYFHAVYPRAASTNQPSQPATPASPPDRVRVVEPACSFHDFVRQPQCSFSEIVGMADCKARLLGAAHDILASPARARNGILLFGEPGNGKNMFAEALAGELGVPFFALDYGSLASRWINETPAKVKATFAEALKFGRCVFLIDGFDSFLQSRGDSRHMDQDLANVILTGCVRLRGSEVVLVMATNRIAILDNASIREGRIDFKVEVTPPDLEARKAILRRSVGEATGFHPLAAPTLASLAKRWEGFSAARLASLGRELAVMRHEGVIGAGSLTFDIAMQAMRRLQGSKGRLPENVKGIDEIVLPDISRLGLHNLAFRLCHVRNLERLGGSVPRGVLFYGPPGTGKTQSAMSLAKASGYAFLKTTGAELLANPSTWDRLVRDAKDLRPAIVFISEADGVLGERRISGIAPLTNQLLATLDGADGRVPDILYICATNSPASLDPAFLRGGRLQEAIAFPVPTHVDLAAYVHPRLKVMAGDVFAISRHTIECAVAGLKGRSIGDADAVMQRIIDAAALRHLREGTAVITAEDVRAALRGTVWSY
jgi:transitional endoplasmic reticulum ATPase